MPEPSFDPRNSVAHVVVEAEIRERDGAIYEQPVAVISLVSENNWVYNRLFFNPCGHIECAMRFEMSLN
jgi:hypothetical protein